MHRKLMHMDGSKTSSIGSILRLEDLSGIEDCCRYHDVPQGPGVLEHLHQLADRANLVTAAMSAWIKSSSSFRSCRGLCSGT